MQETSLQQLVSPSLSKYSDYVAHSFNIDSSGTAEVVELHRSRFETNKAKNKLSVTECLLLSIWIFLQCGAPFGIEFAISAMGIWYTCLGVLLIPFVYSIPQSLICTEMCGMVITTRSSTIWVHRAFGSDFISFMYCLNYVISTAMDLPIILILICQYVQTLFGLHMSPSQQYFLMLCFVILPALLSILDLLSIHALRQMSVIVALIMVSPLLIGLCYAKIDIAYVYQYAFKRNTDDTDNWSFGLCMLLWLYSGWRVMCMFQLSKFCDGQLRKKRWHIPFITAILLSLVFLGLTLLTTTSSASDTLAQTYNSLLDNLGIFVSLGGICCNVVKYMVLLDAHSQSVWLISHNTLQGVNQTEAETVVSNIAFGEEHAIQMNILPSCLLHEHRALLVTTLINAVSILCPLQYLVQLAVLFSCFAFVFQCGSFLKLRYVAPSVSRPYKVCGSIHIAWLITASQFAMLLTVFIIVIILEPYVFIVAVAMNIALIIWYLIYRHLISLSRSLSDDDSIISLIAKDEESKSWYASNTSRVNNIW